MKRNAILGSGLYRFNIKVSDYTVYVIILITPILTAPLLFGVIAIKPEKHF